MNEDKKIIEFLRQTGYFDVKTAYRNGDNIVVLTYPNCIIVEPLTAEAERKILMCPYTRTLKNSTRLFALYRFPQSIEKDKRDELPLKFKSRLDNLLKSRELGQVALWKALELLPKEFLKLKFTAKPYEKREDYDYKDDQEDTACKQLAKEPKTFETIEKVSLTYNTLLILHNAKESRNKSLFYYEKTKDFYRDCVINYILEHSKIVYPENFKYAKSITEVHMPAKEFLKLFPNRASVEAPNGVEVIYDREGERLSKKDTVTLKFSEDFLTPYKSIIQRLDENVEVPMSFVKVPMFFVLEALKSENLGANGFKFLLWLLPYFRMKEPKILHSLRTIMTDTGMDMKHGLKTPLALLEKYFNYLLSVNMLIEVYEPLKFDIKNIDEPPKYRGHLIRIGKPKKPKNKD